MSPLTQAMLINAVVLVAVLEADLGPHRKVGRLRIVRPLLMAGAIVPLYLTALTTHGTGLDTRDRRRGRRIAAWACSPPC